MAQWSVENLTIGMKQILLIGTLLALAVTAVVQFSTSLFREDNTLLVEQLNAHEARALANESRQFLEGLIFKAQSVAPLLDTQPEAIFDRNPDFFAVGRLENKEGILTPTAMIYSPRLPEKNAAEIKSRLVNRLNAVKWNAKQGSQISRISLSPIVEAVEIVFQLEETPSQLLALFLDVRAVERIFKRTEGVTGYLVDRDGFFIAHSEQDVGQEKRSAMPGLSSLLTGDLTNRQIKYVDPSSHQSEIAAFRQVGIGGLGVVAEVPEDVALETSQRVVKVASWVALVVFLVAIAAGSFYSGILVLPILGLTDAARKIAKGDLKVRVPIQGEEKGDEIRQLSRVFNEMAHGLEERERYRNAFNKYHDREIVEKILSGDVELGGEKREAVVLFTDLRDFTVMSDSIAPEAVVEMLNEYMARMVRIIRKRGGVIDKFMGDAIMATWGVPFGSPEDASNAVTACLEMRQELKRFNTERTARSRDPLQMGMGLHLGSVIAGNIGSEERMEYTVIGDTVNLASRLESMTKELKVDLLVSEAIRAAAGAHFGFQAGPKLKIRGKTEEIQVYSIAAGSHSTIAGNAA